MNIGEVKDKAIKLIAQYSNGGVIVPTNDNADYLNKANSLIDQAQKKIATKAKIHSRVSYSQYPITPINGKYYGFEMKQYLPTGDDLTDVVCQNARAFYFEVNGNCFVSIEESLDQVTWTLADIQYVYNDTLIDTINPIAVSSDLVYKQYKGLVNPTSDQHFVRIRMSSAYPFVARNRALWDVPFVDPTYVPVYTPKLEVEVTDSKWMKFDRIVHRTDSLTYQQMIDFSSIGRKTFIMDYFYTGSFDIHYYKVPEDIDSSTTDATELEVYEGMAQEAIPYYVAGHMIADEYPSLAMMLLNEFQAIYEDLKTEEPNGAMYVHNTTGW